MNLLDQINEALAKNRVEKTVMTQIVGRLLAEGSILREASQVSTRLYDALFRIEDLVSDYLEVAGIELIHEEDLQLYRITPAKFNETDACDESLIRRPGANLSALLTGLWLEYEEAFRAGELSDTATASVNLSKLNLTMAGQLNRPLPTLTGETRSILREAVNLRVVRCDPEADLSNDNFILEISPLITRILSGEKLAQVVSKAEAHSQANLENAQGTLISSKASDDTDPLSALNAALKADEMAVAEGHSVQEADQLIDQFNDE